MALPTIVTFWHGPMSWLEHLSAASFVRQGHKVEVYSYEEVGGLPEGVRVVDAATILPSEALVFYKGRGTPGVFSDYFRASLMAAERGVWADLDMVCLRPLADMPDYILGWERPGSINGAVLRLPAGSPLLGAMLSIFTQTSRPLLEPHLPIGRRLEVAAKRLLGMKVPPEYMQYGATGPFALTYYAQRLGVAPVQPQEVFYPVPYTQVGSLMREGSMLDDYITPATLAVHVWRSQITARGRQAIPEPEEGSALALLCGQLDVPLRSRVA